MKRLISFGLLSIVLLMAGCDEDNPVIPPVFRGNPITDWPADGVLRTSGSPYLATTNLIVESGRTIRIEPGVELRFEPEKYLEIRGSLIAEGNESNPITFTSGLQFPDRGDWDGIWLIDAGNTSVFKYCKFLFGAKYGRRYNYRDVDTTSAVVLDSTLWEYGSITTLRSDPTIERCWFIAGGFHGVHCDSMSQPRIYNNVFYDNAGNGIYVHWTADPDIRYNVIIENDDYGIYCRENSENPRATLNLWYNDVWSNFSGEYNLHAPSEVGRIVQLNDNLDECDYQYNMRLNPGFRDPEKFDFRLNSCSAVIDAGPSSGSTDPDGTRIELGIYSYTYLPGEIRRRIPNLPLVTNTLYRAKSPYYMTCDVELPQGETLTIEAGVTILVGDPDPNNDTTGGHFTFTVNGAILSQGTAENPVIIKSVEKKRRPSGPGDWVGFVFPSGGDDGTVFNYTTISNAEQGINLERRDANFDHCILSYNLYDGLVCRDLSSPTIKDCQFIENSFSGVVCQYNSSPLIERCLFIGGEYGISAQERSNPIVSNNIIDNVGTTGIRMENLCNMTIVNNTIVRSGYYGIYCEGNSSPAIRNNILWANGRDGRGGIAVRAVTSSQPVIAYNCFWEHFTSSVWISNRTELPPNNFEQDPLFVDPVNGNFRLQPGSHCMTNGDPGIHAQMGAYGGPNGL